MYSLVLMMALGTGSDGPAFGRHGCHGCNGCSGYASAGCSGGCHGGYNCSGCHERRRLFGGRRCHGCSGGCHGSSGCHGGGYMSSGCNGGCSGSPYMGAPPGRPPETVPAPKPKATAPRPSGTEESRLPAPATLRVSLPADAALTVDGAPTASRSAARVFVSPELPPDMTFYYTLKADFVRDGREFTSTKKVPVRAGEEIQVSMDVPLLTIPSK